METLMPQVSHRTASSLVWVLILLLPAAMAHGQSPAGQPSGSPGPQRFGWIDSSVLLAFHPMFQRFDITQRRFLGTTSAGHTDPETFRKDVEARAAKQREAIVTLDEEFRQSLQRQKSGDRQAYDRYWLRRKALEHELQDLQAAALQGPIHGSYDQGMPATERLLAVIDIMGRALRNACEYLQQTHGLVAILDAAAFRQSPLVSTFVPPANHHWTIWSGQTLAGEDYQNLRQAWANLLRAQKTIPPRGPFVAGCRNMNSEALTLFMGLPPAPIPPRSPAATEKKR
jgi:hypothetical protein